MAAAASFTRVPSADAKKPKPDDAATEKVLNPKPSSLKPDDAATEKVSLYYREHILSIEYTFYLYTTHSIHREHIVSIENTFYLWITPT